MSLAISNANASIYLPNQLDKLETTNRDVVSSNQFDAENTAQSENITQSPVKITTPAVSNETQSALLQLQEVATSQNIGDIAIFEPSSQENLESYFDERFSNDPPPSGGFSSVDLLSTALFLPNAETLSALSEHASVRFEALLSTYNIPSAPSEITFDNNGQLQLPADYPYADELTQAFEENPGLERELRTINALSSHYTELQKIAPFHAEYANANTQAEALEVIEKYKHLLQDRGNYAEIALTFSKSGNLTVTADGENLSFDT